MGRGMTACVFAEFEHTRNLFGLCTESKELGTCLQPI
jgi:hypothetical protein